MSFFFFPILILVELAYWPIQSTDPIMLKILLTQIKKFIVACCWMDGLIGWSVTLHTGVWDAVGK